MQFSKNKVVEIGGGGRGGNIQFTQQNKLQRQNLDTWASYTSQYSNSNSNK